MNDDLPIADHALIGDCHSAALVSRGGSIDWCCLPRFDSDSCFARLLDREHGGHFAIFPPQRCEIRREYLGDSLVLATTVEGPAGTGRLTDFFAMRKGGERNWGYRYSWIRDSVFTTHALTSLGCNAEADGFRRFIQRASAGNGEQLQVLVGIDGKRRLTESTLDHLAGWRGSKPARIGNAAEKQYQADMFGVLLELAGRWSERGNRPDEHYWDFLVEIVDTALEKWRLPDRGIWEVRGPPRDFVQSKVMCWAAVQRGIELATRHGLPARIERWSAARDEIREAVETQGIDRERGNFVAAFGTTDLDAALLLLPDVGFVAYDDERMLRTTEAIRTELDGGGGLILRYSAADGLQGKEGAFLACSFWLAECMARQGRTNEARELFERVCGCANDLGLFAEEYSSGSRQLLGNFPQGLTHLAHISAALALSAEPPGAGEAGAGAGHAGATGER